jgi:hypothetical protein
MKTRAASVSGFMQLVFSRGVREVLRDGEGVSAMQKGKTHYVTNEVGEIPLVDDNTCFVPGPKLCETKGAVESEKCVEDKGERCSLSR